MPVIPLRFCLRVNVKVKPLNLKKTTCSILSVLLLIYGKCISQYRQGLCNRTLNTGTGQNASENHSSHFSRGDQPPQPPLSTPLILSVLRYIAELLDLLYRSVFQFVFPFTNKLESVKFLFALMGLCAEFQVSFYSKNSSSDSQRYPLNVFDKSKLRRIRFGLASKLIEKAVLTTVYCNDKFFFNFQFIMKLTEYKIYRRLTLFYFTFLHSLCTFTALEVFHHHLNK